MLSIDSRSRRLGYSSKLPALMLPSTTAKNSPINQDLAALIWSQPHLRSIVYSYSSKGTLAKIATLCRSLFAEAVNVLYKDIHLATYKRMLKSVVSITRLRQLSHYASAVHKIRIDGTITNEYQELFNRFPNLRMIVSYDDTLRLIQHPSDSLSPYTISFRRAPRWHVSCSLLDKKLSLAQFTEEECPVPKEWKTSHRLASLDISYNRHDYNTSQADLERISITWKKNQGIFTILCDRLTLSFTTPGDWLNDIFIAMRRGDVRHRIFQEMNIHRITNCRNIDFTNGTDDKATLATIIENASFSVKKLIIGSSYLYSRSQTPPEDLGMNLVNFLKTFFQPDLRFTSAFRELVHLKHLTLRLGCYPSSIRDLSDLDMKIEAKLRLGKTPSASKSSDLFVSIYLSGMITPSTSPCSPINNLSSLWLVQC
ncbi:hypothetical protein L486_06079 [Kwoniella mangroviensis CBS 10435]|uniref:Uncharacterized protein n=1 Tax=Kwoniella mangroviensis CBS 10435 TaxID=1331196 RepID=A0A1B9IKE1_9TREE|nr:hypothetical protein L486_06079 [Kwoniella mangroviensis CBS 10435]OCF78886.1 hypothetical protein I204_00830 [Kwoniella mangroviensis CBS 8886]